MEADRSLWDLYKGKIEERRTLLGQTHRDLAGITKATYDLIKIGPNTVKAVYPYNPGNHPSRIVKSSR
jgi:hypothetical protein